MEGKHEFSKLPTVRAKEGENFHIFSAVSKCIFKHSDKEIVPKDLFFFQGIELCRHDYFSSPFFQPLSFPFSFSQQESPGFPNWKLSSPWQSSLHQPSSPPAAPLSPPGDGPTLGLQQKRQGVCLDQTALWFRALLPGKFMSRGDEFHSAFLSLSVTRGTKTVKLAKGWPLRLVSAVNQPEQPE